MHILARLRRPPQADRLIENFQFVRCSLLAWAVLLGASLWVGEIGSIPGRAFGQSAQLPPLEFHPTRTIQIKLSIPEADRSKIQAVELYSSRDLGYTWRPERRSAPDQPHFPPLTVPKDGEYWFAVRTIDLYNRRYPPDDQPVKPMVRLVVDSTMPSLQIFPEARQGTRARIRWQGADENIDLSTLRFMYRVDGTRDWFDIPFRAQLSGEVIWDAGSLLALEVRGIVQDRAGHREITHVQLADGSSPGRELTRSRPTRSTASEIDRAQPARQATVSRSAASEPRSEPVRATRPNSTVESREASGWMATRDPLASTDMPSPTSRLSDPGSHPDSHRAGGNPRYPRQAGDWNSEAIAPSSVSSPPAQPNLPPFISDRTIRLRYALDDVRDDASVSVELWGTRDGGRNWVAIGGDSDRNSPLVATLPADGRYGLTMVVRSSDGRGDLLPRPGDRPNDEVIIDTTPPIVQLHVELLGRGESVQSLRIAWRAQDLWLADQPVQLQYRSAAGETDWLPIASGLPSQGEYAFPIRESVPNRILIRVIARDRAGQLGLDQTSPQRPIVLSQPRPRGRILRIEGYSEESP